MGFILHKKSLDQLGTSDILFLPVEKHLRKVRRFDEKVALLFEKRNVDDAYCVQSSSPIDQDLSDREEAELLMWLNKKVIHEEFSTLREEIFEALAPLYQPFDESNPAFSTKIRNQFPPGEIFKEEPSSSSRAWLKKASEELISSKNIKELSELVEKAYRLFNSYKRREKNTQQEKHVFPAQSYYSIRLQDEIDFSHSSVQIRQLGNAVRWHAVDTMLYFLATLSNINKIRANNGAPLSSLRYLSDNSALFLKEEDQEFSYPASTIISATLGMLLSSFGVLYKGFIPLYYKGFDLSRLNDSLEQHQRDLNNFTYASQRIVRNLLRDRDDISSVCRLVASGSIQQDQKEYRPHEFVRLAQLVRHWDILTQTFLLKERISTHEAIKKIYFLGKKGILDEKLIKHFFLILKPWELYEELEITNSQGISLLRVYPIKMIPGQLFPLFCVRENLLNHRLYPDQEYFFQTSTSELVHAREGKVLERTVLNELQPFSIIRPYIKTLDALLFEDPFEYLFELKTKAETLQSNGPSKD